MGHSGKSEDILSDTDDDDDEVAGVSLDERHPTSLVDVNRIFGGFDGHFLLNVTGEEEDGAFDGGVYVCAFFF